MESTYEQNMRHEQERCDLADRQMNENFDMLRRDSLRAEREYEEQQPPEMTKAESIAMLVLFILFVCGIVFLDRTGG